MFILGKKLLYRDEEVLQQDIFACCCEVRYAWVHLLKLLVVFCDLAVFFS